MEIATLRFCNSILLATQDQDPTPREAGCQAPNRPQVPQRPQVPRRPQANRSEGKDDPWTNCEKPGSGFSGNTFGC